MLKLDVLRNDKRTQVPLLFLLPVSWTGSKSPHVSSLCDLVVRVCRTDKNAPFRQKHWFVSTVSFQRFLMLNYSYLFLTVCINTEELNLDSTEIKNSLKDFSLDAVNRSFSMSLYFRN